MTPQAVCDTFPPTKTTLCWHMVMQSGLLIATLSSFVQKCEHKLFLALAFNWCLTTPLATLYTMQYQMTQWFLRVTHTPTLLNSCYLSNPRLVWPITSFEPGKHCWYFCRHSSSQLGFIYRNLSIIYNSVLCFNFANFFLSPPHRTHILNAFASP